MIRFPVTHQRDFRRDFPVGPVQPTWLDQGKRIASATLPLLAFHRPLRGPLSGILGTTRAIMQVDELRQAINNKDIPRGLQAAFHGILSVASVATAFFNPVLSMLLTVVSDSVEHIKQLVQNLQARDFKAAAETIARLSLDILYIASICYGAIEITVALMLLQVILESHDTVRHFKEGRYLEGVCQGISALLRTKQLVPQAKLMAWKWNHKPSEKGWLYRGWNGNLMLTVPKKEIQSLHALYKEAGMQLPPWIKNWGWSEGHITVATSAELTDVMAKRGLKHWWWLTGTEKQYNYRFTHMDAVKPFDWKGASKVQFATVVSPELDQFREKIGLAPRPIDFHATFGVKYS